MGWVHTERTLTVSWPSGAKLGAGSYHVLVTGQDHNRAALVELAHISRVVKLEVKAPAPAAPTPPPSTTAPAAGVPSPAQSAAEGAVFPVQGTFSFGGPENRFGAPRDGYFHEGQDVLTAEGTPVVAPYAGTITHATNQEGGGGYYLVEHTHVGFDFMFAHCEANSFAVKVEQTVSAGQRLCLAGRPGMPPPPTCTSRCGRAVGMRRGPKRSTRCLIWKLGRREGLRDGRHVGLRAGRGARGPMGPQAGSGGRSGRHRGASIGRRGEIAQLVEHTTENRGVPSSNLGLAIGFCLLRGACIGTPSSPIWGDSGRE